jgi:O-antigen/teichoic acid export membrane protein
MKPDERNEEAWFAAKRFGYGAGIPITWQGWVTLAVIVVLIVGFALVFPQTEGMTSVAALGLLLLGLVALIAISARKTRGGWRWRWGERD